MLAKGSASAFPCNGGAASTVLGWLGGGGDSGGDSGGVSNGKGSSSPSTGEVRLKSTLPRRSGASPVSGLGGGVVSGSRERGASSIPPRAGGEKGGGGGEGGGEKAGGEKAGGEKGGGEEGAGGGEKGGGGGEGGASSSSDEIGGGSGATSASELADVAGGRTAKTRRQRWQRTFTPPGGTLPASTSYSARQLGQTRRT
jgi:hypothetical protein